MDWFVQLSADVLMVVLGNPALMMSAFAFFFLCALIAVFGFAVLVWKVRKKSSTDDVY